MHRSPFFPATFKTARQGRRGVLAKRKCPPSLKWLASLQIFQSLRSLEHSSVIRVMRLAVCARAHAQLIAMLTSRFRRVQISYSIRRTKYSNRAARHPLSLKRAHSATEHVPPYRNIVKNLKSHDIYYRTTHKCPGADINEIRLRKSHRNVEPERAPPMTTADYASSPHQLSHFKKTRHRQIETKTRMRGPHRFNNQ